MAEEMRQEAQLPIFWDEDENVRALLANQFLGQIGPQGEVLLTFGQLIPPALLGGPEQVSEQLKRFSYIPVKPVARIAITRFGLDELIRVLNETRNNYQEAEQARKGGGE